MQYNNSKMYFYNSNIEGSILSISSLSTAPKSLSSWRTLWRLPHRPAHIVWRLYAKSCEHSLRL